MGASSLAKKAMAFAVDPCFSGSLFISFDRYLGAASVSLSLLRIITPFPLDYERVDGFKFGEIRCCRVQYSMNIQE